MKNELRSSGAQLTRRSCPATIIAAAVAGIAGVAASARKSTIIYAGTEQIGRNLDTIRLISQITSAVATLLMTLIVMRLVDVMNNDTKEERTARLRRHNFTALIAALPIDILMMVTASELIQTPAQAAIPSGSTLTTVCTIVGVVDAFTAHAVFGALALSFISFRRILLGGREAPEYGTALRMLVIGSAALQVLVSVLYTACTLSGTESGMAEALGCACVHSVAFTVLMVIFVRCWQKLAAVSEALLADEQPESQSGIAD